MKQFEILTKPGIVHGITTRLGGVSTGPYATMNTGIYGNDDWLHITENIKRALDAIGADAPNIVATRQVHSKNIAILGDFSKLPEMDLKGTALEGRHLYVYEGVDGLMTQRTDVVLMTFYADCVPLVFYDPVQKVVASVHSGWKGTAQGIGAEAIRMMCEVFHSNSKDILAAIGHSAGVCCYEVDDKVIEAFKRQFSLSVLQDFIVPKDYGKYMLDLKAANAALMRMNGIPESNIEVDSGCTICGVEKYHSHRRAAGNDRGSMSAFVQLKK